MLGMCLVCLWREVGDCGKSSWAGWDFKLEPQVCHFNTWKTRRILIKLLVILDSRQPHAFCPTFWCGHLGTFSFDCKNEVIMLQTCSHEKHWCSKWDYLMLPISSYEIPYLPILTSSKQKWRNAAAFSAWPSVCGGQPKHAPKLPYLYLPLP